mmetsp:Transcript_24984/g.54472  ORF Transcript_24984/g.54472 Transcript_24984/m.54472 type:complete len:295 (-) Transcript_24984:338-1222(-)
MFVLMTVADTICIPPYMFVQPTLTSVHSEIEAKFPNRVLMDAGLVVCRYGDALEVGDGVLVAGDGAAHHEVVFRLVVFRPFVEEVLVGTVAESTEEGIRVSLGFFEDVFIPGSRMQRPSYFDKESGLWIWTPRYGDDQDAGDGGDTSGVKTEESEEGSGEDDERFEIEIGEQIRFKVKAINFTRVTNTVKGVQATTTTTRHSTSAASVERTLSGAGASSAGVDDEVEMPVRKRSSSVDLSDASKVPASMHITASICEEGLGLISWWTTADDDGGNEDEEELVEVADEDEDTMEE